MVKLSVLESVLRIDQGRLRWRATPWAAHGAKSCTAIDFPISQGHISQAIALEREAQNHTNVFEFWTESSEHLAEMMAEESINIYGAHSLDDGLSVLAACDETLAKVINLKP